MSEPTENKDYDFKKFGESFEKKFMDFSETVMSQTKALESKVDGLAAKKEPPTKKEEEDDIDDDFFGEDKKIEKKVEQKVNERLGEFKQEQKNQTNYLKECSKWDGKAYEEFPMKRADFKKEVEKEITQNMAPIAKDENGDALYPPDAVYNAASRVFARKVRAGEMPSEDPPLEELEAGDPRRKIKGKDINETQLEIGRRLGLSEEQTRSAFKNRARQKRR